MRNKDIIKQYVNTGKQITKYQFDKLNSSLLKSYYRKRIISSKPFSLYEFDKANDDVKNEYIDYALNSQIDEYTAYNLVEINKISIFLHSHNLLIYLPIFMQNNLFNKLINLRTISYFLTCNYDVESIVEILGVKFTDFRKNYFDTRRQELIFATKCDNILGMFKLFDINIDEYTDELLRVVFAHTNDVTKISRLFKETAANFFHNLNYVDFEIMYRQSNDRANLKDEYYLHKKK